LRVLKCELCHTGRSYIVTLPAPLLVSVTLDTVLSVMSQYLIDVTQVELMESSCGSCLWDIKPKSFSLVWPVFSLSALCVRSVCFRTEWSASKEPAGGEESAIVRLLCRRLKLWECTSVSRMAPSLGCLRLLSVGILVLHDNTR